MDLPSSLIFCRTFHVRVAGGTGTLFSINYEGRQYLVTARHVIGDAFPETGEIEIAQNNRVWRKLTVRKVGYGSQNTDIAVLAAPHVIVDKAIHSPAPTAKGLVVGQDVFFLGFPLSLQAEIPGLNGDFPLPLVKKACLSLMQGSADTAGLMMLDGINNPGFSGGPVVFYSPHDTGTDRVMKIAAVISAYRYQPAPIHFLNHKGELSDQPSGMAMKENTGIIISYNIRHAIDAIEQNPIGALLDP